MDAHALQLRGRKVAIKKITDVFDDLTDAKRILREMKLLRHLGVHENIINVRPLCAALSGSCPRQANGKGFGWL